MSHRGVSRRELLAGAASLAVGLPGCAGVNVETNYERSVERSYGVAVNSLALEMPRGDLTVREADGHEVTLSGSVVGKDRDAVDGTEIVGDQSDGRLTLSARRDGQVVDDVGVDLTVRAPRDTRVSTVSAATGSVSLNDVVGPVRAATGTGTISAERVTGRLTAVAERGEVSVSDVDGGVSVSLSEGEVSVADVDGDVSVTGVDGDVSITSVDGDVHAEARVGFVSVSDVTGDVRAVVESGDTDVVDVGGDVYRSCTPCD